MGDGARFDRHDGTGCGRMDGHAHGALCFSDLLTAQHGIAQADTGLSGHAQMLT